MSAAVASSDPRGGVAPQSRRVSNLAHFLTKAARRLGDRPALVWGEKSWTWAQFDARVGALARGLAERYGVRKGDRVLVQSQNCNQLFESMLACFRLGAVWVPTNFRQTPDEVAYLGKASGAVVMICNGAFADHADACRAQCPELKHVAAIGDAPFGPSLDDLIDEFSGRPLANVPVEHDDPCWFFYTSGTTGRPKASVLTHGQMSFVVVNHLCDLMPGTDAASASLVVAPLSHGAGIHQLVQVAAGATTVLMPGERFDVEAAFGLIQRWRVSNMFTVPTILKKLVEDPAVDRYDHSSLKHVIYAGAPMYRADQKKALEKLGPVIVQYFGLGEVTGNITVLPASEHHTDDGRHRIGSCGYERTGMEVAIQREDGTHCAAGETGEICVIGPAVFAGYYDNPDANAKAFRDGWFRTGDLGHMDENGYLHITGRQSDMYISGGSNVYPREIEEKILMHPAVSEAAVIGIPDPVWGEVGVAVLVGGGGHSLDPGEIADFLAPKIARYKLPKRFLIWDEMPKSAYGKITKKLIREELERRGELALPRNDAA